MNSDSTLLRGAMPFLKNLSHVFPLGLRSVVFNFELEGLVGEPRNTIWKALLNYMTEHLRLSTLGINLSIGTLNLAGEFENLENSSVLDWVHSFTKIKDLDILTVQIDCYHGNNNANFNQSPNNREEVLLREYLEARMLKGTVIKKYTS
ncbi:hypothetical protein MMC06_002074 [Schaereria dolodes]|nr:hypothetical protein [Schaereria dolodes]